MAVDEKKQAAVYVSWTTFSNELARLSRGLLPNRIDKSVFPGQSWGVINQLLAAFKFLGLIDDDGKPTESLKALAVSDPKKRDEVLSLIIRERYADLFALDLTKATPDELGQKISAVYGATGDTRDKAARFFLAALAHLRIPVSPFLTKAKPSAGNGGGNGGAAPRRRRAGSRSRTARPQIETPAPSAQPGTVRTVTLRSGGSLTVSATLNLFALDSADRRFLNELIEKLEDYEQQGQEGKGGDA
jgi:hypothetical protein